MTSVAPWLGFVLLAGATSLAAAGLLARNGLAKDEGTPAMQLVAAAIREGAHAFLRRQYRTVTVLALGLAVLVFVLYRRTGGDLAWKTTAAFVAGAVCSGAAGYWGMFVSLRANVRVASAARASLGGALRLALRGGAAAGLAVVSSSLLGVGALFLLFGGLASPQAVPFQLVGFAFGASFVALFAQLGGGIYTKAADVGADLVGKIETGIPEDDPRNPAVIADLVGDNVGDCAGTRRRPLRVRRRREHRRDDPGRCPVSAVRGARSRLPARRRRVRAPRLDRRRAHRTHEARGR